MRYLTLRDRPEQWPDYEEKDTDSIVNALYAADLSVTREAAHEAWKQRSADECAGWLSLPGSPVVPGCAYNELSAGWKDVVDTLLHGVDGVTLNGRNDGPFLVLHGSNEEVER